MTVLSASLTLAACGDHGSSTAPTTTSAPTEVTTTAGPVTSTTRVIGDDTFVADDVIALCADLGGLADIDPRQDPTQADVDRLRTIATTAPEGVALPLGDVAAYGQAIVDGGSGEATRPAAVEAVTILIAYGNEVCDIDVPLFDTIAGV